MRAGFGGVVGLSALSALLVAGSAGFAPATTATVAPTEPALPKTYASALTPAQIATLSANPTSPVIILLADQHSETPGSIVSTTARAAVLSDAQKPLLSELKTVGARNVHSFGFVNAVSATVSPAEAARLATNPAVASVVPDVKQSGPTSTNAGPVSANGASAVQPNVATPSTRLASNVCPSVPSRPLLEPEALQLMNVPPDDVPDGAPGQGINGDGVKVAVFPDGLDPNIPDFIRQGGPNAGSSAIFDYQDFSGDGINGVTGAAEAFGDASSIIAQGSQVYDLSGEVNPAHPLPTGCNIRIQGVAPGASLAVMKVFGNSNLAFNSVILEGMEYAINHDHVDIMSQSFGGNPVPNNASDPIAVFDADAVAAGVTVVVSTGDAGVTNTIATPATVPGVISAAASTSYQIYAQTSSYGYGAIPGTKGWVSNNIGSFSSSGVTEYGPRTATVIAPGENNWADCSANTQIFTECADIYHGTNPQPIVAFGGTSESCPLTAATAAIVIEAYRNSHGGATPSPALVKQIIASSSTDIDARGDQQGAGLVDTARAEQTAQSVHDANGSPASAGLGFLYSPTSISQTGAPGHTTPVPITVTNTSPTTETISPSLRQLGPAQSIASGTITLNEATDPTFIYQTGAVVGDVHVIHFTVPAGLNQLNFQIAWLAGSQPASTLRLSLFDPAGKMESQSRPQGAGGGYGDDLVTNPAAGKWSALVFATGAYNGKMAYTVTGSAFQTVNGGVVPSSRTIPAGGSATFVAITTTPSSPGDLAESVVFNDTNNTGAALGTIPVTLRAMVPVHPAAPATFNGTLTGGNARMTFYGQELIYQFQVPPSVSQINVRVSVDQPGYAVLGFLADPNMVPADIQSTLLPDNSGHNTQAMSLSWHDPIPGTWNLDLTTLGGVSSLHTSVGISGTIDFNAPKVSATGLPSGNAVIKSGQSVSATVTITNTGNSFELYSLDPRLNTTSELSLASLNPTTGIPLPVQDPSTIPQFVLPPFSTAIGVLAQSTVPIDMTSSPDFGTPEFPGVASGNSVFASKSAPDLPASIYSCGPNEQGPFPNPPAPSTTFSCGAAGVTRSFDASVSSATGNIWLALEGLSSTYHPLILAPGQTGTIPVTITGGDTPGKVVSGSIAVESFNFVTISSDQLTLLPYTYKVG